MAAGRKLELEIDGQTFQVQVEHLDAHRASVLVNGQTVEVAIRAEPSAEPERPAAPAPRPTPTQPPQPPAAPSPSQAPVTGDGLRAVMPGVVVRLDVEAGQQVTAGQILLVLEAMKMENEIRADRDATITQLPVAAGQKVQTGQIMISFG